MFTELTISKILWLGVFYANLVHYCWPSYIHIYTKCTQAYKLWLKRLDSHGMVEHVWLSNCITLFLQTSLLNIYVCIWKVHNFYDFKNWVIRYCTISLPRQSTLKNKIMLNKWQFKVLLCMYVSNLTSDAV